MSRFKHLSIGLLSASLLGLASGAAMAGVGDINITNLANASDDVGDVSIAYNATDNQYATAWWGDDTANDGNNVFNIFVQIVDAATNANEGARQKVSSSLTTNVQNAPRFPAIAYNSTDNEYLVAWRQDSTGSSDREIFGAILNADGSVKVAAFQISQLNGGTRTGRDAAHVAVTYNPDDNIYLVVWSGDGEAAGGDLDQFEIYGQHISAAGTETGTNDFKISDSGIVNANQAVRNPSVAYDSASSKYLAVWEQNTNAAGFDAEIFGQLLNGDGSDDGVEFQISNALTSPNLDAKNPAVAANSSDGGYLVVWFGNQFGATTSDAGISGNLVAANGAVTPADNFAISDTATLGNEAETRDANVVYNALLNEYGVTWPGSVEIDRVAADGTPGADDPLSTDIVEPGDGGGSESAPVVAVAFNSANNSYFALWAADPDGDTIKDMFGQLLALPAVYAVQNTALSVAEGTASVTVTVNRIVADTSAADTVDYATADGTAESPADYTGDSNTLNFGSGETSKDVPVAITNDDLPEVDETFTFVLEAAKRAYADGIATVTITDNDTHQTPVASAGTDQLVAPGAVVTLDGSGSDAVHTVDSSTYAWSQTAGDAVALSDAAAASPTFTAPATAQTLTFDLEFTTTTAQGSLSNTDSVTVRVSAAPTASAGPDQTVTIGDTVILDATASADTDAGDSITYLWAQTSGDAVTISDTGAAQPTFETPTTAGDLVFTLTVTDSVGLSSQDTVTITVEAASSGGGGGGGGAVDWMLMLLGGLFVALRRKLS